MTKSLASRGREGTLQPYTLIRHAVTGEIYWLNTDLRPVPLLYHCENCLEDIMASDAVLDANDFDIIALPV